MSRQKVECQIDLAAPSLEMYMKEMNHVTADMRRFIHKMKKIRSHILGPQPQPKHS